MPRPLTSTIVGLAVIAALSCAVIAIYASKDGTLWRMDGGGFTRVSTKGFIPKNSTATQKNLKPNLGKFDMTATNYWNAIPRGKKCNCMQDLEAENGVIVMGGFGGSGTRTVEGVLGLSRSNSHGKGICMYHENTNRADDNLNWDGYEAVISAMINTSQASELEKQHQAFYKLCTLACGHLIQSRNDLLDRSRCRKQSLPWGWKSPKVIHILPILHNILGDKLKFVHIVRDPRSLLCPVLKHPKFWSKGCNLYHESCSRAYTKKHRKSHFIKTGHKEQANEPDPLVGARVYIEAWQNLNLGVEQWARSHLLAENYIRVYMEEFLSERGEEAVKSSVKNLVEFAMPTSDPKLKHQLILASTRSLMENDILRKITQDRWKNCSTCKVLGEHIPNQQIDTLVHQLAREAIQSFRYEL